jgi:hypothetical protein
MLYVNCRLYYHVCENGYIVIVKNISDRFNDQICTVVNSYNQSRYAMVILQAAVYTLTYNPSKSLIRIYSTAKLLYVNISICCIFVWRSFLCLVIFKNNNYALKIEMAI